MSEKDSEQYPKLNNEYEVLIVGGGPAGLSGALSLGRLRRKVLLCDDGHPRNLPSEHMNNFPGADGMHPETWRQKVRQDLQKYPITLHKSRVQQISQNKEGFSAQLSTGETVSVRKVLLAYGIRDVLPEVKNIQTLFGKTVVHCPFCHGFEFQDQRLALLGDGEMVAHLIPMLLGLSRDLILLSNSPSQLTAEQKQQLSANGVSLIETPVTELEHQGEQLTGIRFNNGELLSRDALYIAPQFPLVPASHLGEELGCQLSPTGWYEVDNTGKTNVPGVYAAGDISGMQGMSVINSAAGGSMAGARIGAELLHENFNRAVQ